MNKLLIFFFLLSSSIFSQQIEQIEEFKSDKSLYSKDAIETRGGNSFVPTINSESDVSSSGGFSQVVPIEVFKGINDFQPNISLVYNSQTEGGLAGAGWNISGLSSITLGGKSLSIDNSNEGVVFDGTDPYYLDGQRLIYVNGEYRTESLSSIKIKKNNAITFTVHFTDGRISTYKKIGLFDFLITEMQDAFGNKITYEYFNDGNVNYIRKISYGDSSLFSIIFDYKDNPNRTTAYINGHQLISRKVASTITVNSKEGIYRRYELTHDYTSLEYPRLRKIIIYNQHNQALKPLKFNYNSNNSSRKLAVTSQRVNTFPENTLSLGSIVQGDFEGKETISSIYVVNEHEKNNPRADKNKEFYSSIVHEKFGAIVSDNKFDKNLNLHAGKFLDGDGKLSKNDVIFFIDRNQSEKQPLAYNSNIVINTNYTIKAIDPVTRKEIVKKLNIPAGVNVNKDYRKNELNLGDDFFEISGDFNNDGLVDLLIFRKESLTFHSISYNFILQNLDVPYRTPSQFNSVTRHLSREKYPSAIYLYEVGKEMKNPGSVQLTELATGISFEEGLVYPINYDRDGITDFLFVDEKQKSFNIKSLKRNPSGQYSLITKLDRQSLAYYEEGMPFVFGDFNGDGLTDFMIPSKLYDITKSNATHVANEISRDRKIWREYINQGSGHFKTKERDFTAQNLYACKPSQRYIIKRRSAWQNFWSHKPDKYLYSEYVGCGVIATDFNNDGRSDFVVFNYFGTITPGRNDAHLLNNNTIKHINNLNSSANLISFVENKPSPTEEFELNVRLNQSFNQANPHGLMMSPLSPFAFISETRAERSLESYNVGIQFLDPLQRMKRNYNVVTHNFLETKISQVDNGSGVIQDIEYVAMSERITSPYVLLRQNNQLEYDNLYYQTDNTISNHLKYPYYVNRKQPGLYLVNRVNTLFDDKAISKEYRYVNAIQDLSGKGFLGFQRVASSNPYESVKQDNQYVPKEKGGSILWSVNLSDPLQENQLIANTIGDLKGEQYSTKSAVKYKKITDGHAYTYVKAEEISEDKLRDFSIFKSFTYNAKGFLISSLTDYKTSDRLTSEERFEYEPDFTNGHHLFAGKIKVHENRSTNNTGTFSSKNVYNYSRTNGNVIRDEKYGHNTTAIVTEYKYDAFGNKIEETLSGAGINTLSTKLEYDATKRFATKTISPEGKEDVVTIDLVGNHLTAITSLGLKTSYKYDSWGNNTEVVDPYNIKTTLVKENLGHGKYSLSTSTPGVPSTIIVYDKFDRAIQQNTQSIHNKWSLIDIEYDLFGKKIRESEPYFEGESKLWNITEYDALDRIRSYTESNGKITTTYYEGLGVTVDDGYKKTSKLYNSAGQIIKHTDKGGSILYDYYPNGTLKSANYDGIVISVVQDGWGNKIEMNDPSAGKYTYKYNALGNILEEISPKGKTVYAYDRFYKLIKEDVTSDDNSTININYEYNPTTLLPTKTYGTSNGNYYEYETFYDDKFRLKGKKETTKDFIYESYLSYDSENKVADTSLQTTVKAINKTVHSKIANVYDNNGFLIEERDALNNRTIKRVNEVNAQGQVKQLAFGNNLRLTTNYNKDFLPSQINLNNNAGVSQLRIDYNFNTRRGLLEKRNIQFNGLAGSNESFTFDELDRLTEEKENNTIVNSYVYDAKGRMVYNSDVGQYSYTGKNYKIHSIDFNNNGSKLIQDRGFHQIKFNSYKQATEIYLAGKDHISYDFNLFKERSIAYYGNENTDKNSRPYRKFYTLDKAVEIQFDGNNYKVITYVDGDPYSSSYIQINEFLSNGSEKQSNYFLHRDIQGTILALSSTEGKLVEKRLFDAWGNIKQVVHEDGTVNKTLGLIDRGYTGHEHLQSVGLIHMNGRLYDAALRRFISPDNFIQDPYNTQNFDRYSYVYNNPLIYTDPSGEIAETIVLTAYFAFMSHAIMNSIQGIPIWHGMGKMMATTAVSAGLSFGIGTIAKTFFESAVSQAFFQAGAHAVTGGAMSAIDGGKFYSGFASGAMSSLVGSGIAGLELKSEALSDALTLASGGLTGGFSSMIAGGSFSQGMRQGLIFTGFNNVTKKFINTFNIEIEDNTMSNDNKIIKGENGEPTIIGNNIILFDRQKQKDIGLYDYAIRQDVSSDVIKIFGHGGWGNINESLNNPKRISDFLYDNNSLWRDYIDGGKKISINVEIHACNVAKNSSAIAYKFSKNHPSINVKAPSDRIMVVTSRWSKKGGYSVTSHHGTILNNGKWLHIKNGKKLNEKTYDIKIPKYIKK